MSTRHYNDRSNSTTTLADGLGSAAQGIRGGYEGNSFTLEVLIVLFPALSIYNVIELVILIFCTFAKYKGLYFWSLLISSVGIIPYSLGFLFKFNEITLGDMRWFSITLITIGWYSMVTGQAIVLWSRLHLILGRGRGQRTLNWTKWMIIINVFILHVPTTVLTYGSNGNRDSETFAIAYNIMEKIQMSGFFVQEVILSTIYLVATVRILRTSIRDDTRRIMYQLFAINIVIIVMDLALLGMEAASLYLLETIIKGVFYSIKLKLEFAILSKLVEFVGGRGGSVTNNEERNRQASIMFWRDNAEKTSYETYSHHSGHAPSSPDAFTNYHAIPVGKTSTADMAPQLPPLGRISSAQLNDISDTRNRGRTGSIARPRPGMTSDDVDIALFQHNDSVSLLPASHEADEAKQYHYLGRFSGNTAV